MGKMMRGLLTQWNESRKNNSGMTFVEVICAVAIFALVSSTIGGIIVFSARSYQRGISETTVQQEAQFAANNIGNIVKDACSVLYGESNQQFIQNGEDLVTNEDGTARVQLDGQTELSIITNKEMQYSIMYVEDAKTLLYQEIDRKNPAVSGNVQLMAQNITAFEADTSDFKKTRTIKLTITVEDENTGRAIPMEYTMTSRNEVAANMTFESTSNDPVIIFLESDVILVPGETYSIPIVVVGKLSQGLENGSSTSNVDVGTITTEYVDVTVPRDTTAEEGYVQIQTKDRAEDGTTPKAVNGTNIKIRRVRDIQLTYAINSQDAADGNYESNGAEYIFYANVDGSHLAKSPGSSWDSGYKRAQAVYWKYKIEVGGTAYEYEHDALGDHYFQYTGDTRNEVSSAKADMEQYIMFVKSEEDVDRPLLRVKLMQDMASDFVLTVTATSKHALGKDIAGNNLNKAGSRYPDDAALTEGVCVIQPRATKLQIDANDLILEPNEDGRISIDVKGGSTDLDCYLYECTNAYGDTPALDAEGEPVPSAKVLVARNNTDNDNAADAAYYGQTTYAKYISSTNEIKIHIGNNEVGNFYRWFRVGIVPAGKDPGDPENPQNGAVFVRVRVRRVEYLKMSYRTPVSTKAEDHPDIPPLRKGATYLFKVDVQRWNLKKESALENDMTQYISPYALEIHWEFKKGGNISMQGKYVCTDLDTRIDKNGQVTTSNDPSKIVAGSYQNEYLKIRSLQKTDDGPSIVVELLQDFPGDAEFTIYATALHPLGTYDYNGIHYENRTGQKYDDVSGWVSLNSIFGEPTDIVADPTQGMSVADHRYELRVPIEIKSTIGALDGQIVGNQQAGTKFLSDMTIVPSKEGTAYVYLAIDPAEVGGGKGTYKMANSNEEISYDCAKGDMLLILNARAIGVNEVHKSIGQVEIPIHLRRVEEVQISKKSSSGSQLVLNGNVTKGCGENWSTYFNKQNAEWDSTGTNGFVGYKTPYSYKWELSYDDGKTWIPLDQNSAQYKNDSYVNNYIDSIQIANPTDSNAATEGTLTLNLKKTLENGVQIKMTSLHSIGENRGGQPYDKEVFDIYTLRDGIIVADGFKRGKDYTFIKDIVNVRADVFEWGTWLEQASFYRYKEFEGGTWSKYHMMDSGQTTQAWANYVPMSYLFRPDKEYAIEIVSVLYNKTDKLIYWPLDEELLEPGRGWLEAGFTLWKPTQEQWKKDLPNASQYWWPYTKYQDCYNKVQQIPEIKQTFMIPKSEMSFYPRQDAASSNALTVNEKVISVGSESEPIRLNGTNGNVNEHSAFIVNLEITGYEMNTDQQCFRTIVQKKSGDQWVTLGYDDDPIISGMEGFKVDSANPYISIYRTANARGLYRAVPIILAGEKTGGKIKWRDVTDIPRSGYTDMDVLFNPEYTTTEEDYHLYDYNTGKYVIYFEFYQ